MTTTKKVNVGTRRTRRNGLKFYPKLTIEGKILESIGAKIDSKIVIVKEGETLIISMA